MDTLISSDTTLPEGNDAVVLASEATWQLDQLQRELHRLAATRDAAGLMAFVIQNGILSEAEIVSDFGTCPHPYPNPAAYLLDQLDMLDDLFTEMRENGASSFEDAKLAMTMRCAQTKAQIRETLAKKKPR